MELMQTLLFMRKNKLQNKVARDCHTL